MPTTLQQCQRWHRHVSVYRETSFTGWTENLRGRPNCDHNTPLYLLHKLH